MNDAPRLVLTTEYKRGALENRSSQALAARSTSQAEQLVMVSAELKYFSRRILNSLP